MLEILLWIAAIVWVFFFIQMVLNWFFTDDLSRIMADPPERWPSVSIVVPARNEERGITEAVSSFCSQDYPDFEVIVVDDCSTDKTPQFLAELQKRFMNLRVVHGKEPPQGWLGKPNALELGKKEARGEWLLFVDADVVYAPDLLRRSITYVLKRKAAMLVLEPRIVARSLVEALSAAGLYLLFIVSFPVFLVSRTRNRFFAAGIGAFNMVRRDALVASGAFASIRSQIVDDLALGYAVKRTGGRIEVAGASSLVAVRQYHGAKETFAGFTKNTYPAVRKFWWGVPFMLGLVFITSFLPYFGACIFLAQEDPALLLKGDALIQHPAILALIFMHATYIGIVFISRLPWYVIFLHPAIEFLWWWIFFRSWAYYLKQGVIWRGRTYRSLR